VGSASSLGCAISRDCLANAVRVGLSNSSTDRNTAANTPTTEPLTNTHVKAVSA
jgi:hypothetical protein